MLFTDDAKSGMFTKKGALRFRVVDGDAVYRYVDAGDVAAADAEAGVAHAGACIGAGHHGGQLVQQQRQVLAEVLFGDIFPVEVAFGEGSVPAGAEAGYFNGFYEETGFEEEKSAVAAPGCSVSLQRS